jgi:hypothetical protein
MYVEYVVSGGNLAGAVSVDGKTIAEADRKARGLVPDGARLKRVWPKKGYRKKGDEDEAGDKHEND